MLAIFASGNGTTLQKLIECQTQHHYQVSLVVVNRACNAQQRAEHARIPTLCSTNWQEIDQALNNKHIQLIVLAGFLAILPQWFCEKWKKRIINTHPSLLPKFGGKGMYGKHVHQAVIEAGETESGCTIHYVSSEIDEGEIIAQSIVPVHANDTAETLAARVQTAEKELLPKIIADITNLH